MSSDTKFWWGSSNKGFWICTTNHPLDFSLINREFFAPRKQLLLIASAIWLVISISLSLMVPFSAAVPSIVLLATLAIVGWLLFGPRVPTNLARVKLEPDLFSSFEDYEYVVDLFDETKQKYARGTLSTEESLSVQKTLLEVLV